MTTIMRREPEVRRYRRRRTRPVSEGTVETQRARAARSLGKQKRSEGGTLEVLVDRPLVPPPTPRVQAARRRSVPLVSLRGTGQAEAVARFAPDEKKTAKEVLDGLILKHEARRWASSA